MSHVESTSKTNSPLSADTKACLDACRACADACLTCAKACAADPNADHFKVCIQLDQDCASVCTSLGDVLARGAAPNAVLLDALLGACIASCNECAKECDKHAKMMASCGVCAEACRRLQTTCQQLKGVAHA